MKRIKFELKGGRIDIVDVPLTLYDVSTYSYQRIIKEWNGSLAKPTDAVRLFAIITNRPYVDYIESKDANIAEIILKSIRFMFDGSVELKELPLPTHFYGHEIPKDFGKLTVGQNLHIKQAFVEANDDRECISLIIAIAMQPIIDGGNFNDERIEFYRNEFDKLPITTTYPIATFLFNLLRPRGLRLMQTLLQIWSTTARKLSNAMRLPEHRKQKYLNHIMD